MTGTALITGASSGIGLEIARLLARRYDCLILTARSLDRLLQLKEEISRVCDCRIEVIPADLSEADSAEKLYTEIHERKLQVDLLVNNAGAGQTGPFLSGNAANDRSVIELNIFALTGLCRLFASDMIKQHRGKILNVASTGAFQPGSYIAVYYASKAYVYSFTLALADELKGSGIYAGVLCPGATVTNFSSSSGKADIKGAMSAAQVAQVAVKGLEKSKVVIIPGFGNKLAVAVSKLLPDRLMARIVRKIQKKQYDLYQKQPYSS